MYVLSNKLRRHREPVEWMKEKWPADFSKPEKSCFIIKSENSYDANLEEGSSSKEAALFLGLKKKNCMAWLETVRRVYVDQAIEAHFRFDGFGGYCAAGMMFRIAGPGTYYLALISNKGYFRLDAVNNDIPKTLIGWTEAPGLNGGEANLGMILKGDHLIFFLNGRWLAEAHDDSIPGGHLGFALVSYESEVAERYICQSWLDFLSVDSRAGAVEAEYRKWRDSVEISAESRFRLAGSFAALNCFDAAYDQILKAWKQREDAARSVMATYTEIRGKAELVFAAQIASQLEHYAAAEEYITTCLSMDAETEPSTENIASMPSLYALLGFAYWNLNNYIAAAAAWEQAFALDGSNGLYAACAANAFEEMGKSDEALRCCLSGAQCFLQQKNREELEVLIPKLQAGIELSPDNKELAALVAEINKFLGKLPPEQAVQVEDNSPGKNTPTEEGKEKGEGRREKRESEAVEKVPPVQEKPEAVATKETAVKPEAAATKEKVAKPKAAATKKATTTKETATKTEAAATKSTAGKPKSVATKKAAATKETATKPETVVTKATAVKPKATTTKKAAASKETATKPKTAVAKKTAAKPKVAAAKKTSAKPKTIATKATTAKKTAAKPKAATKPKATPKPKK
jgi:tetratricopeptide (TPR) repeat protein